MMFRCFDASNLIIVFIIFTVVHARLTSCKKRFYYDGEKYSCSCLPGMEGQINNDDPNVVVDKMALLSEGGLIKEVELTGDLSTIKNTPFVIKAGAEIQIQVTFRVNRENVSELCFCQLEYRKGVKVCKSSFIVGSYEARGEEPYEYLTPVIETNKGMIARGHYTVKSKFVDNNKNSHMEWEWSFDLKKEWE